MVDMGERIDAAVDFDYDKTKFERIDDNGALAKAHTERDQTEICS
jgi:hypothetical protein